MPGESTTSDCCCFPIPGTTAPGIAPYVVSLNSLYGIVGIAPDGGVSVRTSGNTIYIGANGSAGLGTVTSVNATSSNNNLVVTGGPVTTTGTFAFSLAGNLNSISGLTMAADQTIYATGAGTFAATSLTTFGRSLIDDADATAARSTLGLVIGTNVQAWSADLDSFVTNATWAGSSLTLTGSQLTIEDLQANGASTFSGAVVAQSTLSVTGAVTGASFAGDGSALTNLDAGDISAGTLAVARGGTGLASYTTGDIPYASAATTIAKLAAGAAGTFLRFAGAGVAPVVSTLVLPNAATTGDIFIATGANTMGRLADVAALNVLLSGGVGVAPAWGKVTLSHTTGIAGSGTNTNIDDLNANVVTFGGNETVFNTQVDINSTLADGAASTGTANDLLTSTGTGVAWSNQIIVSTIRVDGLVSLEGTITAAGSTGAKTINKQCGTVRFAAGAGTLVITNSLALAASTRALAAVCSVDTTLKSVAAVVTDGFITLTGNGNATAETEVYWELRGIS